MKLSNNDLSSMRDGASGVKKKCTTIVISLMIAFRSIFLCAHHPRNNPKKEEMMKRGLFKLLLLMYVNGISSLGTVAMSISCGILFYFSSGFLSPHLDRCCVLVELHLSSLFLKALKFASIWECSKREEWETIQKTSFHGTNAVDDELIAATVAALIRW